MHVAEAIAAFEWAIEDGTDAQLRDVIERATRSLLRAAAESGEAPSGTYDVIGRSA
jgi:hypothetical protein